MTFQDTFTKAYIFLCTNATEDECLQRLLFGGKEAYRSQVRNVKPGDKLYLYNIIAQRLHGAFVASSESAYNIDPKAWKSLFPWQVRVKRVKNYEYLTRDDIEDFIIFSVGKPKAVLLPAQIEELDKRFASAYRKTPQPHDYRDDNPATIWTEDGHKVRSMGEKTIDDWLFHNKFVHGYEPTIWIDKESYKLDFVIPTPKEQEKIYIEYWGKNDRHYLSRKDEKLRAYNNIGLKLIELYPSDLDNLNRILSSAIEEQVLKIMNTNSDK